MDRESDEFPETKINNLRTIISENIRVQLSGAPTIDYVDAGHSLSDALTRNNHVIFGRRGTGKTLLLHSIEGHAPADFKTIYINCEDYKNHSFPNVLIELLDRLFEEMEKRLTRWFGKKKKLKDLIREIRGQLQRVKDNPDVMTQDVKEATTQSASVGAYVGMPQVGVKAGLSDKTTFERQYQVNDEKLAALNLDLPKLKRHIRDFFALTDKVKAMFIELDDFYQLSRFDQPFIIDFVHRLCKDLPLYFKVGTLRHSTALYVDKKGQPFGAQERHDYQPINVDYTLGDLDRTSKQLRLILENFASKAGWSKEEIEAVFKGEGFDRLVLAAGGVPRDFLSFLLEFSLQPKSIGKDDVRQLTRPSVERRIQDLKSDSKDEEQADLLRGIYAIREFCLDRGTNVFLISERDLNKSDEMKQLINRLLDYRIIHSVATALTRKRQAQSSDTYQAFMIDLGFYANLRKLQGRFNEYDIRDREQMRNAPLLTRAILLEDLKKAQKVSPEEISEQLAAETSA